MLSTVLSSATYGINAYLIEIETNIENTVPNFFMVGLPDNAVKESRERVATAIRNSGFAYPNKRVTINLAPADVKKEGSSHDLAIAVGMLAASGQVRDEMFTKYVILGELALDGSLRPVHGVLPISVELKKKGFSGIILPKENAREAAMVEGMEVYGMENLMETISLLNGDLSVPPMKIDVNEIFSVERRYATDFSEVKGQENV